MRGTDVRAQEKRSGTAARRRYDDDGQRARNASLVVLCIYKRLFSDRWLGLSRAKQGEEFEHMNDFKV